MVDAKSCYQDDAQKLFDVKLGWFDWKVSITENEGILQKERSYFYPYDVNIRKSLPVRERNLEILANIYVAMLFETNYFFKIKNFLGDNGFREFAQAQAAVLKDMILSKDIGKILKKMARKERYRKKIKAGHKPKRQLKLLNLNLVA